MTFQRNERIIRMYLLSLLSKNSLIVGITFIAMSLHAQESSFSTSTEPKAPEPKSRNKVDLAYEAILENERKGHSDVDYIQGISAGLAALTIGTYGYYNEDKGTLVKLIYGGTQTAGVLIISNSILGYNRPSLVLSNDFYFRNSNEMSFEKYKNQVVRSSLRMKKAELKQTSYTSLILGSIYLYNGSQEDTKALRNFFYFLGGNFILISGASFYRLFSNSSSNTTKKPQEELSSVSFGFFPYLTMNMTF